jgi:hypothetical protein
MLTIAFRFCRSELHRNVAGPTWLIEGLVRVLARPTEVGARTIVHGATAGPESHGQYVPDCVISPTKGLTRGSDGADLEARVWKELQSKLEAIKPGVTKLS